MTKQPESLRLADALTTPYTEVNREAANELRRLHEVNVELLEALKDTLYFLERHSNRWDGVNGKHPFTVVEAARAAIAKATGETE